MHFNAQRCRYVQRKALSSDPNWLEGHYYDTGRYPFTGMKTARLVSVSVMYCIETSAAASFV